jgi:hypothetical protein
MCLCSVNYSLSYLTYFVYPCKVEEWVLGLREESENCWIQEMSVHDRLHEFVFHYIYMKLIKICKKKKNGFNRFLVFLP